MATFLGIVAVLISALSLVLSARAVLLWLSRPSEGEPHTAGSVVVAGVPSPGALDPATLKAIAASDEKGMRGLAVGRIEGDQRTRASLEDLHRMFPEFDICDMAAVPDRRHVLETALGAAAFSSGSRGSIMLMASHAGPSTPTIRSMSFKGRDGHVFSAFPARRRLGSGHFSASSDIGRLTPALYGLFGPSGVCSGLTVTERATVAAVLLDPLTMNRPSLGAAIHAAADSGVFTLAVAPVAISNDAASVHLTMLSRIDAGRYAAFCVSLLAGPLALAGSILLPVVSGQASVLFGTALIFGLLSRCATALTWPASAMGLKAALVDAALSPLTDAPAFLRSVSASFRPRCMSGAAAYVMRSGGLMLPERD